MSTDNCRPIAFRLIMVTACMTSTGGQKGHVPPINGGGANWNSGGICHFFCPPSFHSLLHPWHCRVVCVQRQMPSGHRWRWALNVGSAYHRPQNWTTAVCTGSTNPRTDRPVSVVLGFLQRCAYDDLHRSTDCRDFGGGRGGCKISTTFQTNESCE